MVLAYSERQTTSKTVPMNSIYDCPYGIFFFGTPHRGSTKAHLLGSLQKIASFTVPKDILEIDSALVRAYEEESEILQRITDQFSSLLLRFHVFLFWEQERTDLKYTKDYIMDEASPAPMLLTQGDVELLLTTSMCKFETKDSPGVRIVIAALRRYYRDAPEFVHKRRAQASVLRKAPRWNEAQNEWEVFRKVLHGIRLHDMDIWKPLNGAVWPTAAQVLPRTLSRRTIIQDSCARQ